MHGDGLADLDFGEEVAAEVGNEGLAAGTDADEGEAAFNGAPDAGLPELFVGRRGFVPVVDGHLDEDLGALATVGFGEVGEDAFEADEGADIEAIDVEGDQLVGGGEVFEGDIEFGEERELVAEGDIFPHDHEAGFVGVLPLFAVPGDGALIAGAVGEALSAHDDGNRGEGAEGGVGRDLVDAGGVAFGEDEQVGPLGDGLGEDFSGGFLEFLPLVLWRVEGHVDAGLAAGEDFAFGFWNGGHADGAEEEDCDENESVAEGLLDGGVLLGVFVAEGGFGDNEVH